MQKDKDLRLRLTVVDLLKELKNSFTYKELAKIFNIQESLLCRYVNVLLFQVKYMQKRYLTS